MPQPPTTETPVNKKPGNAEKASTPPVADDSVNTENPNDSIEEFRERLREQIPKE